MPIGDAKFVELFEKYVKEQVKQNLSPDTIGNAFRNLIIGGAIGGGVGYGAGLAVGAGVAWAPAAFVGAGFAGVIGQASADLYDIYADVNAARNLGELQNVARQVAPKMVKLAEDGVFVVVNKALGKVIENPPGKLGAVSNLLDKVPKSLVKRLDLHPDTQRAILRQVMNQAGSGKTAHHIIPLEAISKYKKLMIKAAKGGFDMNGKNNGILLDKLDHIGGHPIYNRAVHEELADIAKQAKSAKLTNKEIANLLQKASDTLRDSIIKGTYGPWG